MLKLQKMMTGETVVNSLVNKDSNKQISNHSQVGQIRYRTRRREILQGAITISLATDMGQTLTITVLAGNSLIEISEVKKGETRTFTNCLNYYCTMGHKKKF